jgi:threonine/homoserine/homoserine lactone efflux protein
MSFLQILPLAFVMIAGPQIVSAFFLATSREWGRNSLAYIAGAAVSITTFVTIAYLVAKGGKSAAGSKNSGTADQVLEWVVLALLVALAVHVFLTRKTSEPPKWMGKLQEADPKFALKLGLLLLGIFPTDILTSVTVGLHIGRNEDPWWQCLPFVGMTLLFLGIPSIAVLLLGRRAEVVLPKIRDWMNNNAWVISEIVVVFFAGLTINSLLG